MEHSSWCFVIHFITLRTSWMRIIWPSIAKLKNSTQYWILLLASYSKNIWVNFLWGRGCFFFLRRFTAWQDIISPWTENWRIRGAVNKPISSWNFFRSRKCIVPEQLESIDMITKSNFVLCVLINYSAGSSSLLAGIAIAIVSPSNHKFCLESRCV